MTQQEYEQKRLEGWENFCQDNPAYDYPYCHRIYDIGFDRAFAILGNESKQIIDKPKINQVIDSRKKNRLLIAAQLESAMIINDNLWCQYGHYGMETDFAKLALRFADALLSESEEGGAK